MIKISIGKIDIMQFFLFFLLFSIANQESNIFKNKINHYNLKKNDYAKNVKSGKRLLNKENSVTVIAQGKRGEIISILGDSFKYPPNKLFINNSKENLGQVKTVSLTKDGENIITMIWDDAIKGCEYMFSLCSSLINIDMSNFDSSKITSMEGMFYGASNVTSINFTNFNTSSVTHMNAVFFNCYKLKNLDVSKFDTSSVIMMNGMFDSCYSLTSLDVSKFNTTSTQEFTGMFSKCFSLTSIDLSHFNTSSLTDMMDMFSDCKKIEYLNLSTFYTNNVEGMSYLFGGCENLKTIDFPNLDTTNAQFLYEIFINCTNLEYINIENYKGSDIFGSIPQDNQLTICLKTDNSYIPNSLKKMNAKNICSNNDTLNNTISNQTNIVTNNPFSDTTIPITAPSIIISNATIVITFPRPIPITYPNGTVPIVTGNETTYTEDIGKSNTAKTLMYIGLSVAIISTIASICTIIRFLFFL